MITFKHPDHSRPTPGTPVALETDPVQIIARAMIELSACGRTVTADALVERTMLPKKTILANEEAARDEANRHVRESGRYQAAA